MSPNARIGWIVGGSAAALFLLASCGVGALVLSKGNNRDTGETGGTSGPVLQPKGFEIEEDFARNPIDAERKWMGKRIRVTAAVQEIGRDRDGLYLVLSPSMRIRPARSDVDKFAAVSRFDMIEVEVTLKRYTPATPNVELHGTDARFLSNKGAFFGK